MRPAAFVVMQVRQALQQAGTAGDTSAYRPASVATRARQNLNTLLILGEHEAGRRGSDL